MLGKGKRICPCCGKPLELIPPAKEDLPHRMEESANKIQYYFQCKPRFFSYTRKPKTGFVIPRNRFYFCDKHIDLYGRLAVVPRGNDCFIQTVPYTRRRLEKDKLFFASRELVFLCGNCRKKLSINHNPISLLFNVIFLSALALMILAMLLSFFLVTSEFPSAIEKMLFFILGVVLLTVPASLFALGYNIRIKKSISNFVPTDEYDTLVRLPENLKVSGGSLEKKYLHSYNVFETELDGERFFLYLTEKGKREHKLHICGMEGEPERLLSLIREKQSRGEKVTLPLTFEGKAAGSAEVLETYDPPEPVVQPADDEEYITVWPCRYCGYDNPAGAAECKSCGKWKD